MALVGTEATSYSPEKQGFSAGRGADSGTVADADESADSKEYRKMTHLCQHHFGTPRGTAAGMRNGPRKCGKLGSCRPIRAIPEPVRHAA
jgi:hypothetical protein